MTKINCIQPRPGHSGLSIHEGCTHPKFSVIIPTYNRREKVARAVRSVLAQTFKDFEVIVSDDGSRDGTTDEMLEFEIDERFRLLINPHQGQATARNQAINRSQGEWIVFLDSDDWFDFRRLEILANQIKEAPWSDFIYCNAMMVEAGQLNRPMFDPNRIHPFGRLPGWYAVGDRYAPYVTSTVAIRRAALPRGVFREDMKLLEDTEMYARMFRDGAFVNYTGEALVYREVHAGQITHDHLTGFRESMMAYAAGGASPWRYAVQWVRLAVKTAGYMMKATIKRGLR